MHFSIPHFMNSPSRSILIQARLIVTLILLSSMFSACDDDDSEVGGIANVRYTFEYDEPIIALPAMELINHPDDHYLRWIGDALERIDRIRYTPELMEPAPGASRSFAPLDAEGLSRKNGYQFDEVITYEWIRDEGKLHESKVALQISRVSDRYIFEVFLSYDETGFFPFMYAEESVEPLKEGLFKLLIRGSDGIIHVSYQYKWREDNAGIQYFQHNRCCTDSRMFDVVINPGGSGTFEMTDVHTGEYYFKATWNELATAGTYTTYDNEYFPEGKLVNWEI